MESDKQDNHGQGEDKLKSKLNSVKQSEAFMENPEEAMSTSTLVDKDEAGAVNQISVSSENEAELQQVVSEVESAGTKSNRVEIKEVLVFEPSASTLFEQSFESAKSLNDSIIFEVLPEQRVSHQKQPNMNSGSNDVESIVMREIEALVETSVGGPAETLDTSDETKQGSTTKASTAQEDAVTECLAFKNEINKVNLPNESDRVVETCNVAAPLKTQQEQFTNQRQENVNTIPGKQEFQNDTAMNTENSKIEKEFDMDTIEEVQDKITDATAANNNLSALKIPEASSGLSLLAQYDSENDGDNDEDNENEKISDTDSVVEVPEANNLGYRKKVIEIDSDTTSDSSESDVEYLAEIRKTIEKSIKTEVADEYDDGDDDENSGKTKKQAPRVKGEFLIDDLPPIQDLHITVPEEECIELGKVHSIVDQLVLVNALPNAVLLDLETVLFFDKGQRVLGEVFDVLGQVADPLYCVRFNSNKQIKEKNIQIGEVVYVAPKTQYTQFVILSSLMKMRGSDASWENDIEPPPRYLDYSDDEQEREARTRRRNKDRAYDHIDLTKRTRSDIDCNMEGTSPSPSPSPSPSQQQHHQRRVPLYLRGRDDPRSQRYPQQPHNFRSNYNASSWHSNYPQHYRGPPPNFAPSPHINTMFPPPNFAGYPPRHGGMPPQQLGQPPMYVLNPYAVRGPILAPNLTQPPPPPPPGAQ